MLQTYLKRFLTHSKLPLVLALLGMLLALPSVWTGWQQDDLPHRYFLLGLPDFRGDIRSPSELFEFLDGTPETLQSMRDIGLVPWWSTENLRLNFWRPLTAWTHWLDYALWPHSAPLQHLHSLLWYGVLIALITLLLRRILGNTLIAGLAALLFAIDDIHGLPAGWLANRNALTVGVGAALVLLMHDRWRRDFWKPGMALGPLMLILALMAGEGALAVCAFLAAYAFFIDKGDGRTRVLSLVPFAFIAGAFLVWYSIQGFGASGSGFYVDPIGEPMRFLGAIAQRAPLLLLDLFGFPPSVISALLSPESAALLIAWAVVFLVFIAIVFAPLLKRDNRARFLFAGTVLSLPLFCATMPHGRLLAFVGFGGSGLLALWLVGWRTEPGIFPGSRAWQGIAAALFWIFIIIHGVIAPLSFPLNATSAAAAERYIQGAEARMDFGDDIAQSDLILVNPPVPFYASYLTALRAIDGQPSPLRLRALAPGTVPVELRRTDEQTIVLRPEGGFLANVFDNVFRGSQDAFRTGDVISLAGMDVTIESLTLDGRPLDARFTFDTPLESVRLRWMIWQDSTFVPFILPEVGSSVMLPASPLSF